MTRYICFSVLAVLLAGCEYKPEETNYRETAPPSQFAPVEEIEINLNDINPDDTIYIWGPTRFTCNLNAGQLAIHQVDVNIGNYSAFNGVPSQSNIQFEVIPYKAGYGSHLLKIYCITASGTKSIADLTGNEGYRFEATWNIIILNPADYFTGGYRFNKNEQLELYWENTLIPDSLITSCSLQSTVYNRTLNPQQKLVVVDNYVCGKTIYTIKITFKHVSGSRTSQGSYDIVITVKTPVPKLYVEDIGTNELRFYWNKLANITKTKYSIEYYKDYRTIPAYSTDTTIVITKPAAGYFYFNVNFDINKKYGVNMFLDTSIYYGKKVGLSYTNDNIFAHNTTESVVYFVNNNHDSIAVIDLHSLASRRIKSATTIRDIITSPNSSKVAITSYGNVATVYDDSKLLNPKIIIIQGTSSEHHYILTDEFLFEFEDNSSRSNVNIYDLATGLKTGTQQIMGEDVKISADGQYFASYNRGTINLYTYNGSDFTMIAKHTISPFFFDYCYFHPKNPDQIIITGRNTVELYRLPEFEKLQSTNLSLPFTNLGNFTIDPFTGLAASYYYGTNNTVIASLSDLNNQLYTAYGNYYFYNGCLFSRDGYAADIRKELLLP
ncbi:MAG: hypothetical protein LBV26_06860 [Bacteroidales bacterium]|jgi:hypothetical protein|nr:hypothetical protein [Bacteroidales bacterium]